MDDETLSIMGPWLAQALNLGFVGWLAHHLVAVGIPKLVADFRADLSECRESFVRELREAREAFTKELASEREHCAEHRWRNLQQTVAGLVHEHEKGKA